MSDTNKILSEIIEIENQELKGNIDESLYSRQLYAIGKDTTYKLINSKIFVYRFKKIIKN